MFAHVHFHIQIPRRTAVASGFALAREPHAVAVVDSGGHFHRQLAGAAHPALPEARVAGIAHDGARPAAARTGLLQLEETLRDAHLPRAAAGDRKSTRLNSSHLVISYAVFCLKK